MKLWDRIKNSERLPKLWEFVHSLIGAIRIVKIILLVAAMSTVFLEHRIGLHKPIIIIERRINPR